MSLSQCKGALIVPHWPSAAFWPLLVDHHSKFLPFIKDHRVFENPSLWVVRGKNSQSLVGSIQSSAPILALYIDFTKCKNN